MGSLNYYLNEVILSAGGLNMAGKTPFSANIGLEQIIKYDPEVILLPPLADAQRTMPEALYKSPAWRSIRAIRNRRVYVMPPHFLNNIAVDEPLLTIWLAEILHPEALPHLTRAAYRDLYREVYAYELTDAEIDRALFLLTHGALLPPTEWSGLGGSQRAGPVSPPR